MRDWIDLLESAVKTPAKALMDTMMGELLPDVELHLEATGPKTVNLESIVTIERGLGSGSRTMRTLGHYADELGVTITLQPYSNIEPKSTFIGFGPDEVSDQWDDAANIEELKIWYAKFGFRMLGPEDAAGNPDHDEDDEDMVMIRKPSRS